MEESSQVTILINGVMLDDRNSRVHKFIVEESFAEEFPKLTLFVTLRAEFLTQFPLTDGSPIVIKIYRSGTPNGLESWNFRCYHFDAMSVGDGGSFQYNITAYHESLWTLNCLEDSCYTCASNEVFKRIGDKAGLVVEDDPTMDKQTWFTLEGNRLQFMRDVCAHAFADKYSVYLWWVGKEGVLNFKNIVSRIQKQHKCILTETTDMTKGIATGRIPVMQVTYSMESGINNFKYGYGKYMSFFDSFNTKNRTIYPKDFESNVQTLNVYEDAQSLGWIDCGVNSKNTHANYNRAFVQNKRGLALWSTVLTCIDLNNYPFRLGDCIKFDLKVDGFEEMLLYTGNYLVAGIYYSIDETNKPKTKLFLVRQGISEKSLDVSKPVKAVMKKK